MADIRRIEDETANELKKVCLRICSKFLFFGFKIILILNLQKKRKS